MIIREPSMLVTLTMFRIGVCWIVSLLVSCEGRLSLSFNLPLPC
jgi:hypothetical protein